MHMHMVIPSAFAYAHFINDEQFTFFFLNAALQQHKIMMHIFEIRSTVTD